MLKQRAEEALRIELAEKALKERQERQNQAKPKRSYQRQTYSEAITKSFLRTVGTKLGNQIVRGLMDTLLGKRR